MVTFVRQIGYVINEVILYMIKVFSHLTLAFKPRREELPAWMKEQPSDYKFNAITGIPPGVQRQMNYHLERLSGVPMGQLGHVENRANTNDRSHGVGLHEIPQIQGAFPKPEHGFAPVEVEHNGKYVTKMVMRGPLNNKEDATFPVSFDPKGRPAVKTIWRNDVNDQHNTLDLNRVHLPQEFVPGQLPKRKLVNDLQRTQSNYRPVPHTNEMAKQKIISNYAPKPAA